MELDKAPITITFVTSQISPTFGIAAATVSLAERLAEDYNVRIVTIDKSDTVSFQHSSILHRAWGHQEMLGWKRVITLLRVIRHRSELHRGVIVLSGVWAAIPFLIASRKKWLRSTVVWEHSLTDQHVRESLNTKILRAVARPLYRRAAVTVAVSDLVAEDLEHAGFSPPILVVPNLIRPLSGAHTREQIPGRLLTVGALVPVKNQRLALETLALLPTNYSLDVVGDGPDRAALEQLAEQLGVADRVNFRGYVTNPESYYIQAEIVIQPCEAETFGLALFEAADYRKPVVAPNAGMALRVVPELVPGIATNPDRNAFAAAVRLLKQHPLPESDFDDAAERRRSVQDSVLPKWQRIFATVDAASGQFS